MNSFIKYNDNLKSLYSSYIVNASGVVLRDSFKEEDPQEYLRDNEDIITLRNSGVFFTGDVLSAQCAKMIVPTLQRDSKIIDPCCGAGNLLIALSKHLPVFESLSETLYNWNSKLFGFDLYEHFIEATKLRLIFQAIMRGANIDEPDLNKSLGLLNNIKCKNGLDDDICLQNYTHVLINPPYNQTLLNEYKYWSSGKVNLAAVFIDKYIHNSSDGLHIVAILPDVLRSGTRYEKWRKAVNDKLNGIITLKGKFDKKTDVDVFILNGIVSSGNSGIQWITEDDNKNKLSDHFTVSVGRVVPYRDAQEGNSHAYVYPGLLKSWDEVHSSKIMSKRKHKSEPIIPPFLTIKRTSSPKDKNRAGAHLIYGNDPIYVENHLIVVKPFDNDIEKCRRLLEHLKSKTVNDYLNNIICCRHLTVKAVKNIPINFGAENEKIN